MKIQHESHPYRQLMKIGKAHGRRPRPDDASALMKSPITLTEAAAYLGVSANPEQLSTLETVLAEEIAAVEAYPDGLEAVKLLQEQSIRIGICSNLAFPYRQAVLRCYPTLDAYAFSCDLGVMKPEPAIYSWVCDKLGASPTASWMVGDSQRCDRDGQQQWASEAFLSTETATTVTALNWLHSLIRYWQPRLERAMSAHPFSRRFAPRD